MPTVEPALVVLQRGGMCWGASQGSAGHIRRRGGVVAADRFIGLLVERLRGARSGASGHRDHIRRGAALHPAVTARRVGGRRQSLIGGPPAQLKDRGRALTRPGGKQHRSSGVGPAGSSQLSRGTRKASWPRWGSPDDQPTVGGRSRCEAAVERCGESRRPPRVHRNQGPATQTLARAAPRRHGRGGYLQGRWIASRSRPLLPRGTTAAHR